MNNNLCERVSLNNFVDKFCESSELQFRETSLDLRLYSFPDDPILPFTFI